MKGVTTYALAITSKRDKTPEEQGISQEILTLIVSVRKLTKLLGMLDIHFKRDNQHYFDMLAWRKSQSMSLYPPADSKVHESHPRYTYGMGLKESRDFVCLYLGRETAAATATALRIGIIESKTNTVKPI